MPIEPGSTSIPEFHEKLRTSHRILALCGAGLSAPSGLSTFRGAGGLWKNEQAQKLASTRTLATDPDLVWLFYAHRRHAALKAKPNPGHEALAELSRTRPEFLCLTQNVDGLAARAGHNMEQVRLLHGSLFDFKCSDTKCDYVERDNVDDPLCPALAAASQDIDGDLEQIPLLDSTREVPRIAHSELPHCPKCGSLLRPGVIQFGEELDERMLDGISAWIDEKKVDLVLTIGTQAKVWPAAGYILQARKQGAALAVVNSNTEALGAARDLKHGDFIFVGNAAELIPQILEPLLKS